jgi:signal transduction histidine kinase
MRPAPTRDTVFDVRMRLTRLAARTTADVALAAALFAVAELELWLGARYQGDPVFPGPRLATALAVIPAMTLPLAFRRRAPLAAFVGVMTTIAWSSLAFGGAEATSFFIVALVSVYSAAANGVGVRWVLPTAAGATVVHEVRDPHVHGIGDVVWAAGFIVLGWLFGVAVRNRHRRVAHEAVATERARVARELHDVVAHAVSVVVVQAQAGQRLVGVDDDRARQSLEAIEETARSALNEMRRLLGMLRETEDLTLEPQPGLSALEALVSQVRETGLPVSVEVAGAPVPLSPGAELSVYRFVQEGLTNVLKHAGASRAFVRIRYGADGVEIEVEDDGTAGPSGTPQRAGHGLIGMRERVELYGGAFESGRRPNGGWLLRARLPLEA